MTYHFGMPIRRRLSPIGRIILDRLDDLEMSQQDLATKLGHQSPGLVAHVINGRRSIPLPTVELWVQALHLDGEEAMQFRREAWLAHCPPEVWGDLRRSWERKASQRMQRK